MSLTYERLKELSAGFSAARVFIVGDLILDRFIWGDVQRISPEAPVPIVTLQKESVMPGGAANVAANVRALGGGASIAGVVGDDVWGKTLIAELRARHCDTAGIVSAAGRQTTMKTRIVARHQQLARVDREHIAALRAGELKKIMAEVRASISDIQAIIIEDYGKGVVVPALLRQIVPLAHKHKVIVTVDPKEEHLAYYRGVDCITPNQAEAARVSGIAIGNERSLLRAGWKLQKKISAASVLITRGEQGMCLFEKHGAVTHIPTVAQEVFDVSGAGDTVIAAFTLALAGGASFQEAAYLSNYAAGVVVGKVGVASCSPVELQAAFLKQGNCVLKKK